MSCGLMSEEEEEEMMTSTFIVPLVVVRLHCYHRIRTVHASPYTQS